MSAISIRNVFYRAGKATLIDGIDLEVDAGELVGIIGPNGAGKSTLVRLLAGDLRPAEGTVSLGGANVEDVGALAVRRAVLPQQRPSEVPFTAREVVAMGRHPHRRDPANSRAADDAAITSAMERTDTTKYAGRIFATLSGGEQARVSLARIFAQQTPVLILDEPTAALDVAHEERIMIELAAAAGAGSAVVAVLHDLNTAARYATRLVAMDGGKIAADGSPDAVLTEDLLGRIYRHPMRVVRHPFVDRPLVLPTDQTAGTDA